MEINDKELVDEFDNLQRMRKEVEEKIEMVREKLINLSIERNSFIISGTYKICSVKEYKKVIYPENKEVLIKIIKEKGVYENVSSINYFKLGPKIIKGEVDKEIINLVKIGKDFRVSLINK